MSEQVFNRHSVVTVETKNIYESVVNEFTSYLIDRGHTPGTQHAYQSALITLCLLAHEGVVKNRGD